MNKDREKRLPQLYYIKMKISYDLDLPWQRNDAITLDYFRKKYPEFANNWLVSQIAVRAETVNVMAHLVVCNS